MHDTANKQTTPSSKGTGRSTSRGRFLFDIYRATKQGVMPAGCKLVLLTLADYANDNQIAWPSQDALVMSTGASLTQIKNALVKLEKHGWVKTIVVGTGRYSTRYQLAFGRSIEVPKEVTNATERYLRTVEARVAMDRMKDGEIDEDQAKEIIEGLDGDVSESCRGEMNDLGIGDAQDHGNSRAQASHPGCSQKAPSPIAESTDLLRDLPTHPPIVTTLSACACASPGCSSKSTPTSSSLPYSSAPITPVVYSPTTGERIQNHSIAVVMAQLQAEEKPNRTSDRPAPPTDRSPGASSSSKPTSSQKPVPSSTPRLTISGPNELCRAEDLLRFVARFQCLNQLLVDASAARRWAADQAGVFAGSATRCCDVADAVESFVTTKSEQTYDMTRTQLVSAIGTYLKNAKSIGDNKRSKAEQQAKWDQEREENAKKWGKSRKSHAAPKAGPVEKQTDPDIGF